MRSWAEVDLSAIRGNVESLRRATRRSLIAVVKANGYGLGAALVGKAALDAGARMLAVATVDEAAELRESLGTTPVILVLGALLDEDALSAVTLGVETAVHTVADVERIARAARSSGRRARVHVEVDCGLSRHGVAPEQALALLETALTTPHVELAGVMTHLPRAEQRDVTLQQLARFEPIAAVARARSPGVLVHAAASTACLLHEEARFDAIRPGIALQGLDPDGAAAAAGVRLEPALALRAKVVRVRALEAGTDVGYGATFRTARATKLAVVGIGYDDGLPYRLSNKGSMLLHGARCPIVGTVMMDYTLVDVTDAPAVAPGDVATAIGRDGAQEISALEVARNVGMIPYAVTCGLGRRATRVAVETRAVPAFDTTSAVAAPLLTASARQRRLKLG